ncbi:MAG: pyruvate dehydrogenase complex dihydrolipoamide acetyltransferase [Saprospiraceae bacterium]|nr:pyruvate dehydrogenase complex dihydrolipoamide acetyltransferase [Saprospiraceae bacterium]MBK6480311.1 pyruvate dehydrogenase complex dihydrolipoamide acetyltransferase [Saprospiraceae bacterium]MBK7371871.1 pyruvate dehydrogenase complex dihydrolipoamide acetyltransferase [Saprospiraceae bacterium]MBK7435661.1 pyruvate dehydrogenase complex dihydrolipoamide acetyltransferase [Saprospiraceae bacterium]MBK8281913.1 pyruvate dehydrogenase complex dihydrolipoamide acetyltransferase [Saprospir
MAEVIRMPRMSDTMEEGNILVWHKKVGDTIKVGDVLAEVETDKATMDLESFYDGTLLYIGVASGIIAVNAILAVIGGKEEDYKAALSAEGAATTEAVAEKEAPVENSTSTTSSEPIVPSGAGSDAHVKASPLAKVIAKEAGLDIQKMTGSGDQGRIIKRDVEAALQSKPSPVVQQATPVKSAPLSIISDSGSAYEDKPLSQMRKAIARRLGESKFSAPHFYVTMAIDMTKAVSARTAMNAIAPSKLSFNDLVLKACAMALRKHPAINSSWTGDAIRQNHQIHIGVAVAVAEGLLVPVVRHADIKTLTQINAEVQYLAARAKDKKLQPEEMQGNTFTISNLGMFGVDEFTAIINPPDACILAVGGISEQAVVRDGKIEIGHIMKVTLSCDHRVVDGATGAQFLQTLKSLLEEPVRMLV